MKRKKREGLLSIQVPHELAAQVFPIVEERVSEFLARYQSAQQYPLRFNLTPFTLMDLCRSVYLQGLYDGFLLDEYRLKREGDPR
jgi:hypothetical protein